MPEPIRYDPTEARLRRALTAVLRKIGVVGKAAPSDPDLLRLADDWVRKRFSVATDKGERVLPGLAKPNPAVDDDIPF